MSVGIQSVRQVVLAFSLVSGNRHGQCPGFDYDVFWSRSAATGVATQLLGAESRNSRLVNCLHLGARMADLCFMPQTERGKEFRKLPPLAQNPGIADGNLAALGDQMLREWADRSVLLEITAHDVAPFSTLDITIPHSAGSVRVIRVRPVSSLVSMAMVPFCASVSSLAE